MAGDLTPSICGYGPAMSDATSWDWSRVIFDHVHLRVADLQRSRAFYAAALEPLGIPLLLDTPDLVAFANLAISADAPPTTGAHIAFAAGTRAAVDAFHTAALAAGGTDNGAPGPRAHGAYAAYVLDPDGTNLEATFRIIG
jgi:catechol 2,3-dioxygenase-like lactoylglutathione lyase family enzyme